ncbi:MAG: hypothetical protein B6D36_07115 [Planctomycetes bacterium UTPLA1]|nr:MAG: hypothetical protein B6D36_07115 [Planctomycetes bacterium UTPLA1]
MTTTTKPCKSTQKEDCSTKPGIEELQPDRPASQHMLIESIEYEWATPLNLPGLLVSPNDASSPTRQTRETTCDLIASEDGDIASACQLPGRLVSESGVPEASRSEHSVSPPQAAVDFCNVLNEEPVGPHTETVPC